MFTKVRWDPHKPLDSQTQMQQQQPTQRQQQQLTQIYVDFLLFDDPALSLSQLRSKIFQLLVDFDN